MLFLEPDGGCLRIAARASDASYTLAEGEPLELELEHVLETGELVRWTGELAAFLRDELRADPHPGWTAALAESARALGTTPAELARQVVEKRLAERRLRRGGLPL